MKGTFILSSIVAVLAEQKCPKTHVRMCCNGGDKLGPHCEGNWPPVPVRLIE